MHHSFSSTAEAVNLSDEVWGIEHIALYMKQSIKTVRVLVSNPDFPKPLLCQHRNRRWLKRAVLDCLANLSDRGVHETGMLQMDVNFEPRSITMKGKKIA